ncbi:helix-turn-helix domain-containing protein [Streptomyces sp. WAC 00631]|uniref:helix-turn-helix domain-containing protein n=1 Tax=Streptomyces sp. WAC 00631 TaxID=2203201 RepID=UPI00163C96FB|nr:helix-turn-helix domain-containing protein [Streptomyces sp. WAC 00631]MCC5036496.1 helix-turn-helix domain-containing protein [Streptomyces sp. WAC 00631]
MTEKLRRQAMSGTGTGSTGPAAAVRSRTFAVDVTAPGTPQEGIGAFRRAWRAQVGAAFPLPSFAPGASGGFRVRVRASRVHDAVIADLYSESFAGRTQGVRSHVEDRVLVHVVRRGTWRFGGPHDGGGATVGAGQFIVRHNGPPSRFEVQPGTRADVLILPASLLGPVPAGHQVLGPSDSAEMRVLMAQANMTAATLEDLSPVGLRAARNALVELVRGVLRRELDGDEPHLARAVAQAAKDIVDSRLTDPDLSPSMLARELSIPVRTLHRVFAAAGESVGAYIRRRRLEQARLRLLAAPRGRLSVSELAAYW